MPKAQRLGVLAAPLPIMSNVTSRRLIAYHYRHCSRVNNERFFERNCQRHWNMDETANVDGPGLPSAPPYGAESELEW